MAITFSARMDAPGRLLYSAIVLLALGLSSLLIRAVVYRRVDDARVLYRWRKALTVLVMLVALALGWVWFQELCSWATALGPVSAGLAIALREPLTNLAGWVLPFGGVRLALATGSRSAGMRGTWSTVVTYGVRLTARYLCDPRRRRSSEMAIWEDVLRAFAVCPEVEFAYPTQRFYNRRVDR